MRKAYFRPVPGAPAPLCVTTQREVRFEEVDVMRIVWHGRYASYFEDGRVAPGEPVWDWLYGLYPRTDTRSHSADEHRFSASAAN